MKKLLSNGLVKAVAVGLFVLSVIVFVLSAIAIVALSQVDAYKKEADFEKARAGYYNDRARAYAYGIALWYDLEKNEYADEEVEVIHYNYYLYKADECEGMNFDFEIYDGTHLLSETQNSRANGKYCCEKSFDVSFDYGRIELAVLELPHNSHNSLSESMEEFGADDYSINGYIYSDNVLLRDEVILYKTLRLDYKVTIRLYSDPLVTDEYSVTHDLLEIGYSHRYTAIVLCVLSFLFALILFFYLIFAAGHRRDRAEIVRNPFDRIPCDLFTLLVGGIITLLLVTLFQMFDYFVWYSISEIVVILVGFALAVLVLLLSTLWFMSIATRIKYGKWWKNTLVVMITVGIFKGIAFLIRSIPLIWKSILFLLVVGFLNLIATVLIGDYMRQSFAILLWLFDWILIAAAVFGCSLAYRRLSKGAAQIAQGKPDARIDTSHLIFDFKTHGENLNNIGEGIRRAVDEQMKSERMKTELITDVSHDIKTPLTSIINYVDLLERDGAVTETGAEYLEVLSRQSARLKKLIEDLIQASKASTGNLETHMVPTDSVVLAEQIVGEYQDRMENAGLDMICQVSTENATILADGQLLYRVFDNLLGNICKYAQPGTRVYLDVTEAAGKIRFLFRNISASPLHISPDELTERFVRGDASRNTEGSGLGLSIAKSLTELQGGSFEIEIDGDLFKAILQFDRIE